MTIPIEKKNMDAVRFFKRITIMPFFLPLYMHAHGDLQSPLICYSYSGSTISQFSPLGE